MTNPLLRRLNDLQAMTMMLSGNPPTAARSAVIDSPGCRPDARCLLDDSDTATHVQLVNPLIAERDRLGQEEGVSVMTLRVVPEGLGGDQCGGGGV